MNSSNCKFISLEDSLQQSTAINYISAPTNKELKEKIYTCRNILLDSFQNAIFQFWGAHKAGNTIVLTITDQPYGHSGNNIELLQYQHACLDHKLYIHSGKRVAFGLSGYAFLTCTPVQTQNLHNYPVDERPPCNNYAIFSRTWGSFAVPVIVDGQCVGVLEFVLDTPKDYYDSDIDKVYRALKIESPFQNTITWTPIQNEDQPKTSNKKTRITNSSYVTNYSCLVPHFGLTSENAAAKLGLKIGTFRNVCRRVGIDEWPWIRSTNRERQINLAAASKAGSSQISFSLEDNPGYSDDLSSYMDTDSPDQLPHEQTTNAIAPIPETDEIDRITFSNSFQIPDEPILLEDNSMDTDTSELACESAQIDQIACSETWPFQDNIDVGQSVEGPCEQTTYTKVFSEAQMNQNAAYVAWNTEFQHPGAEYMTIYDEMNNQDNIDVGPSVEEPCEQTTYTKVFSEAQMNQNAPYVAWNTEFQHPCAKYMTIYDEMNNQENIDEGPSVEGPCEQTTYTKVFSEAQMNQNAPYVAWNTEFQHPGAEYMTIYDEMNYQDNIDVGPSVEGPCEQTTYTKVFSEAQMNQNAPYVAWNTEFQHPGAEYMTIYDKMNNQDNIDVGPSVEGPCGQTTYTKVFSEAQMNQNAPYICSLEY